MSGKYSGMKIRFVIASTILISGLNFCFVRATTIRIPADYPTIQAGILAAANGDTIVVSPGSYFESTSFDGKKVVLVS